MTKERGYENENINLLQHALNYRGMEVESLRLSKNVIATDC